MGLQEDGSWLPDGNDERPLTPQEVEDLQEHAANLDPNEILTYVNEMPVLRIEDIHQNWDAQHPLMQAGLAERGLQPGGPNVPTK